MRCLLLFSLVFVSAAEARVRDHGIAPGVLPPGAMNAITDVAGVTVGQVTLQQGRALNTGVTAIVPAAGNLRQAPVPAAIHVINGYGKLAGLSQVHELGEIETPILLTNTLSVPAAMAGVSDWTLDQPGNQTVRSVNAVVGETNDGYLNDIRARAVTPAHARTAIERATGGPVAEGTVGAGTGTVAFGFKGGIGTASRVLPEALGGWTVGALVQANFGGILTVDGVRVGQALGRYYLKDPVADGASEQAEASPGDGSVMIVLATDAPLSDRALSRLAKRATAGLARTGASLTNGSGDYVIAFATHPKVRRTPDPLPSRPDLPNARLSPLFQAAAEASEEAILNALFAAKPVQGHRGTIEPLPVDRVVELWRKEKGR
ncbi:MAG: P1 family peptidase [Rhodothalassiaceae bacterium]